MSLRSRTAKVASGQSTGVSGKRQRPVREHWCGASLSQPVHRHRSWPPCSPRPVGLGRLLSSSLFRGFFMSDVVFIVLSFVVFGLLGLAAKGAERL